jgi:hypothetical protein
VSRVVLWIVVTCSLFVLILQDNVFHHEVFSKVKWGIICTVKHNDLYPHKTVMLQHLFTSRLNHKLVTISLYSVSNEGSHSALAPYNGSVFFGGLRMTQWNVETCSPCIYKPRYTNKTVCLTAHILPYYTSALQSQACQICLPSCLLQDINHLSSR